VQFLRYHQALKLALQERGRESPDDDKDWTTFMLDARFALFDVTLRHTLSLPIRRGQFLRTKEEYRTTVTTGRKRRSSAYFLGAKDEIEESQKHLTN